MDVSHQIHIFKHSDTSCLDVEIVLSVTVIAMQVAELKCLAHYEYWDERYGEVGPDGQVYEWFGYLLDLLPFFDCHLFQI